MTDEEIKQSAWNCGFFNTTIDVVILEAIRLARADADQRWKELFEIGASTRNRATDERAHGYADAFDLLLKIAARRDTNDVIAAAIRAGKGDEQHKGGER